MHTLPRHPISAPDLSDRRTVTKNLEHRRISLLHHAQLHQHNGDPLQLGNDQVVTSEEGSAPPDADPHVEHRNRSHCHPGTGTRPRTGTHLPEPTRQASTGTAQTSRVNVGDERWRPVLAPHHGHCCDQELFGWRGRVRTFGPPIPTNLLVLAT